MLAAAELSHRFDFGPVIGRVNQARRFGESGTQLEVDAYPRIGRGMYLYANAGVSQQRIFPRQRFGAELYKNLPNALETSLGFRQLNFKNTRVFAAMARETGTFNMAITLSAGARAKSLSPRITYASAVTAYAKSYCGS